jgi:hypothetical protein
MNSTIFGEYVHVGGFNQKTIKVDLFVKVNHVYPLWNRLGKTLEHSRRQLTKTHAQRLTCGASRPHLQVGRPMRPTCHALLVTSVVHRLKDQIYAVALSRFDPRAQDWWLPLYIAARTPLPEAILKP